MDKELDLGSPRGTIEGYVGLAGESGRIQNLWARHCGFRLRIAKLQAQLAAVEQELLKEDPSFFEPARSLVGAASFPFRPNFGEQPGPEVAFRNAIILRAWPLAAKKTCLRLDFYDAKLPEPLSKDFPEITTWKAAYADKRCRPRVEKLISEVKADLP